MNYYASKIFANILNELRGQEDQHLFQRIQKNISGTLYCALLIEAHINEIGYEYLKITEVIESEMKWNTLKKWEQYPKMEGIDCKEWSLAYLKDDIKQLLKLRDQLVHLKPDKYQELTFKAIIDEYNLKKYFRTIKELLIKFYEDTQLSPPNQLSQVLPIYLYKDIGTGSE